MDQAPEQQVEVIPAREVQVLDREGRPAGGAAERKAASGSPFRSMFDSFSYLLREAPVTFAVIAANFIVYLVYNMRTGGPPVAMAFFPAGGQTFPQVITYMFAHGNAAHILVNMLVVFSFGVVIERVYGSGRYAFIYLLSGGLSALAQLLFQHDVALIGASGAASALLAIFVRFFPRERVLLMFVPLPAWMAAIAIIALNVYGGVTGGVRGSVIIEPNVGYIPHLAGIAVGLLWAFLVRPTPSGQLFIAHVRSLSRRR